MERSISACASTTATSQAARLRLSRMASFTCGLGKGPEAAAGAGRRAHGAGRRVLLLPRVRSHGSRRVLLVGVNSRGQLPRPRSQGRQLLRRGSQRPGLLLRRQLAAEAAAQETPWRGGVLLLTISSRV